MEFFKSHGTGNDFVVIDDRAGTLDLSPTLVRALCDRRFGVGADGVLRLAPADDADVFMDYRNTDGSIGEMCGNGVRVVAKHLLDHGLVTPADDALRIDTRAGVKAVTVTRGEGGRVATVTVDMGPPILEPAEIPFDAARPGAVSEPMRFGDVTVDVSAVSMGNPHAVIVVDDVAAASVATLGPVIEVDARFPKHTNVEFVQVRAPDDIALRVWERGVGETFACGTGACASLVALQRLGLAASEARIHVPGGILEVAYDPDTHPSVFMTGPAAEVARGVLDEDWITRAAGER